MSTFQERFVAAFNAESDRKFSAGEGRLTKTHVWKAAKATSGAFTQWYDGTTGMKLDTCYLVAPILRVNPRWLFDGTGSMREKPDAQPGGQVVAQDRASHSINLTTIKPRSEKDEAIANLAEIASQLDLLRIGQLIERATTLRAEMPAKQTHKSSQ